MSEIRENLQRALCQYVKDTLSHIDTVRGFCERLSTWTDARKTEGTKMGTVTDQQVLADVLKDTLGGLQKLDCFLDAVEKLAVTSLHVFTVENPVLHLPEGIRPDDVQVVIFAARIISPLLLEFQRDASVFFLPKLQNVEVLSCQLNEYIKTTEEICEKLQKSSFSDFCLPMNVETLVDLDVDLSEDDVQSMLCHINELDEIRECQPFCMVYLFQEVSCSDFISEFSERRPRMLQSLEDLEQCAVQLDRMNKGAKISSVAGSSVAAAGGVLSIAGLALMPVTFGFSLVLTYTGLGMGITSGVNSLVTTATEIGVNYTYQSKASESFQSFMKDMQSIQGCLEKVSTQPAVNIELEYDKVFKLVAVAVGRNINKRITASVEAVVKANVLRNISRVSAEIMLESEELAVSAGKVAMQEAKALPKVAADIPVIGQTAVQRSRVLSKTFRKLAIASNVLFLGMDVFFIVKDSISLAKGSETEVSQLIRARAILWCSEIKSWQKICNFLNEGLLTSKKGKAVLEKPFYPEK